MVREVRPSGEGPAMGTLRSIDRPELPHLIAGIGSLLEEVHENLFAPEYDSLICRLEFAHATAEAAVVEARRRVRFDEGRER